jgi:hypothetical protein
VTSPPTYGSLVFDEGAGNFTYTSYARNDGYYAPWYDSFSWEATDGQSTRTGTVTVDTYVDPTSSTDTHGDVPGQRRCSRIIHEPENALAYNLIRTAEDVAVDVVTVSWLTTDRVLVREIGCTAG